MDHHQITLGAKIYDGPKIITNWCVFCTDSSSPRSPAGRCCKRRKSIVIIITTNSDRCCSNRQFRWVLAQNPTVSTEENFLPCLDGLQSIEKVQPFQWLGAEQEATCISSVRASASLWSLHPLPQLFWEEVSGAIELDNTEAARHERRQSRYTAL